MLPSTLPFGVDLARGREKGCQKSLLGGLMSNRDLNSYLSETENEEEEEERYVQRRVVCLGKGKKFSVADAQTFRAGNSKGGD